MGEKGGAMKHPYTTHCADHASGLVGCFTYAPCKALAEGYFTAISPVFGGLIELFAYCRANGIELDHWTTIRLSP